MAHKRDFLSVEGIRIKIATGTKSQSINIFDMSNIEGNYREVYRIKKHELFITPVQVEQSCLTLADLDQFLAKCEAIKEGLRQKKK